MPLFENLPCALIEAETLTFRFGNGRAAHRVCQVSDGRAALMIDGDDASMAELSEARVAPGHARTCAAEGVLRLGADPVFPLTVDAEGDDLGESYIFRPGELAGCVGSQERLRLTQAGLLMPR